MPERRAPGSTTMAPQLADVAIRGEGRALADRGVADDA